MAARRKYDWNELFEQEHSLLKYGVDYHCSQSNIIQQIRNEASKRKLRVKLSDLGSSVLIQVVIKKVLVSTNSPSCAEPCDVPDGFTTGTLRCPSCQSPFAYPPPTAIPLAPRHATPTGPGTRPQTEPTEATEPTEPTEPTTPEQQPTVNGTPTAEVTQPATQPEQPTQPPVDQQTTPKDATATEKEEERAITARAAVAKAGGRVHGPYLDEDEARANPVHQVKGEKTGEVMQLFSVSLDTASLKRLLAVAEENDGVVSVHHYANNYAHAANQSLKFWGGELSLYGPGRGSAVKAANTRADAAQQAADTYLAGLVGMIRSFDDSTRQAALAGMEPGLRQRVLAALYSGGSVS